MSSPQPRRRDDHLFLPLGLEPAFFFFLPLSLSLPVDLTLQLREFFMYFLGVLGNREPERKESKYLYLSPPRAIVCKRKP